MKSCAKYNAYALVGMIKRQFLVLGMLTRKDHANNVRGKPLRVDLVIVTANTVHCFWSSAQRLVKTNKQNQTKTKTQKKTPTRPKTKPKDHSQMSLSSDGNVCEEQSNYFLMCNAS